MCRGGLPLPAHASAVSSCWRVKCNPHRSGPGGIVVCQLSVASQMDR
jgi:hypothetical protein